MKRILCICLLLALCGCAAKPAAPAPETSPLVTTTAATTPAPTTPEPTAPPPTTPPDPAQDILDGMTVEEKVGQLFLARCNGATAIADIEKYHLGGFVLFAQDTQDETPDTLRAKLHGYQSAAKIPLLIAVDEEGGTVTRISRYSAFRSSRFPSPRDAYAQGGMEGALKTEEEKSRLLASLGINVNLGPVCDISRNPAAFMYKRSFGQDPDTTGQFIAETVKIMDSFSVGSCLKHFPGYGENVDTHVGIAVDNRSLEALGKVDLVPFRYGIQSGCGAIMVSHVYINAIDSQLPATLSPAVHEYLRQEMGFAGVIVTDDLVMQAITDKYGAGEAAVLAVLAGNDLLCSTEYAKQYQAVLEAVQNGKIPMHVLDAAAKRVIQWKIALGLIEN